VQPLPRVLLEKAHGDVEGGAPPAFEGEEFRPQIGGRLGDLQQVMGPDPGGKVRLVRIPHGGVGDEEFFLFENPLGKTFGPQLHEQVLAPDRTRLGNIDLRHPRLHQLGGLERPGHPGGTVDNDIAEEGEHLAGPVLLLREPEQLGMLVDE